MSPSYHSKGASIERSTFNSRGDFSKLIYVLHLHTIWYFTQTVRDLVLFVCDSNDKSNMLLKFLMYESIKIQNYVINFLLVCLINS